MLNLNIDYSTAVILSTTQKRQPTIEEQRQKCVENSKTQVVYDAASKRVIFRFAFATTLFKVQATKDIMSANIVADTNVSAEDYAKNKTAYIKALHKEVLDGKLDQFIKTQSQFISTRLTQSHAQRKAIKPH